MRATGLAVARLLKMRGTLAALDLAFGDGFARNQPLIGINIFENHVAMLGMSIAKSDKAIGDFARQSSLLRLRSPFSQGHADEGHRD